MESDDITVFSDDIQYTELQFGLFSFFFFFAY